MRLNDLPIEWQNFFIAIYNRVGGISAPTNLDLVEKSGSITQIELRSHADLQDLDVGDPHPQYIKTSEQYPIYCGTGTFNSTLGVTISIGTTLSGTNYRVFIQPICSDPIDIGPIAVTNKGTSSFTVKNTGIDVSSDFDWMVVDTNA